MPIPAVVLAAGLGTRMHSPLAKVLHPLLGRPMLGWVIEALRAAGTEPVLVLHHQTERVHAAFPDAAWVLQPQPRGTGDAARAALARLPEHGPVVVCAGDTPLITAEVVRTLLSAHHGPVSVGTFEARDPTGYGRVVRDASGVRIVEQADANEAERRIREVNSGLYVFDAALLRAALPALRPHPPKGEFYLTDLVRGDVQLVGGLPEEVFAGVNDRAQLAWARAVLRRRVNEAWARAGVDFADLDQAWIDAGVVLEPGAELGVGVVIEGTSRVGGHVGHHCTLRDTQVAAGARLRAHCDAEGAVIHRGAVVGPFARLRPGAVLGEESHVGNFVEVKNAVLHRGAKANHLTYLGDAEVGEAANVGAGTITCNYDGVRKNRTTIGPRAFIGSNSALVAPVSVGEGAIVGAGSTIVEDVPPDAIAVGRAPARVTPNAAERLRKRYRALKDPEA